MPSSAVKTCALRSEEHTSELQSHDNIVCRLLLEEKKPLSFPPLEIRGGSGIRRSESGPTRTRRHNSRFVATRNVRPCVFFNKSGTTEINFFSPPATIPI